MQENTNNVLTTEQIKKQMIVGDFVTGAKMLGMNSDQFRMRFYRGKEDVRNCLQCIIENRQELINKHQK